MPCVRYLLKSSGFYFFLNRRRGASMFPWHFRNLLKERCKVSRYLLAFFWISGLVLGCVYFQKYQMVFLPLMRTVRFDRVSIVGIAVSVFLPFLFSAFAVYIQKPILIYGICFIKAFILAFSAYGLTVSFADQGWLVRTVLLASDFCMIPILFWFWLRHIQGSSSLFKQNCVFAGFCGILVCLAERLFISGLMSGVNIT